MTKYILFLIGMLFISMGVISWAVGALMPHDRIIIFIGAVAVAVAGFLCGWQRLQQSHTQLKKTNP